MAVLDVTVVNIAFLPLTCPAAAGGTPSSAPPYGFSAKAVLVDTGARFMVGAELAARAGRLGLHADGLSVPTEPSISFR